MEEEEEEEEMDGCGREGADVEYREWMLASTPFVYKKNIGRKYIHA